MKRSKFGLFALIFGLAYSAQARDAFQVKQMWVSGGGTRIVAQAPNESNFDPIIRVFDAQSHKKLGEITRAHRLIDGTVYYEREELEVKSISKNGHHLLISRLPLITEEMRQELESKYFTYYEILEAWDISGKPRLEWKKPSRDIGIVDARWLWNKIMVLTGSDIQRWSEQGKIQSKVALSSGIAEGGLSPDGTRAAFDQINPILTDTKTGKVILKMESLDYVSYSKFVIGPHSLFVYSETTTFPDDESLPWFDGSIYDIKKKKRSWENPIAVAIFSPDGLATWDWDTKIFRDVETQKPHSPQTPKLFADKTTRLQAISDNGHVWAGEDAHFQPIWTFIK